MDKDKNISREEFYQCLSKDLQRRETFFYIIPPHFVLWLYITTEIDNILGMSEWMKITTLICIPNVYNTIDWLNVENSW